MLDEDVVCDSQEQRQEKHGADDDHHYHKGDVRGMLRWLVHERLIVVRAYHKDPAREKEREFKGFYALSLFQLHGVEH